MCYTEPVFTKRRFFPLRQSIGKPRVSPLLSLNMMNVRNQPKLRRVLRQYVQPCLLKNPKYTFYTIRARLNMAEHTVEEKKNSTLCKHRFPCNTLTHSTNEDLLNIKRKGDPEVSYPLSYVRYH